MIFSGTLHRPSSSVSGVTCLVAVDGEDEGDGDGVSDGDLEREGDADGDGVRDGDGDGVGEGDGLRDGRGISSANKVLCLLGFLRDLDGFRRELALLPRSFEAAEELRVIGGSGGNSRLKWGLLRAGGLDISLRFQATPSMRRLLLTLRPFAIVLPVFNNCNQNCYTQSFYICIQFKFYIVTI